MISQQLLDLQESREHDFEALSDRIWETPETRYKEFKSSSAQKDFLRKEGFRLEEGIGGIETAFMAEKGSGKPVIAICGEFDALPGLSQKADDTQKDPVTENGPGHGCGHNLLGTAALEAAVLAADLATCGTIRYYGCPAEEGGAGKAFMVRSGCFDGCDIALSWHPNALSCLFNNSLANARIIYEFFGISSHAAAAPQLGRSALDAAELMNVGCNFLREHIISEARLHYAFLDAGGPENIVQPYCKVIYAIRAPRITQVGEIMDRVNDVARGAALMTSTKVKISIASAYANLMHNDTLDDLMLDNAKQLFPLQYTEQEKEYARGFAKPGTPDPIETGLITAKKIPPAASTDFGDVSWIVPSSCMAINCYAKGTVMHTWQATSQGKSSIAHKGMHSAAAIIAATALDVLKSPDTVEKARKDLETVLAGEEYRSLIPEDAKPGSF